MLKVLHLARMGRPDLLRTVNYLARKVTKSNVTCDKRLFRLICYIQCTAEWEQVCFIGNRPEECWHALFCDASFASDLEDSKSTTGTYLCICGDKTYVAIRWVWKTQTAVSHSGSEAEIVALDTGLRTEGIPAIMLWELVLEIYATDRPQQNLGIKVQPSISVQHVLDDVDKVCAELGCKGFSTPCHI